MKKAILILAFACGFLAVYAQQENDDVMKYRRSSLYSLMVNHSDNSLLAR